MAIDILHRPRGRVRRGLCGVLVLSLAGCAAFEGPQPSDAVHTLCYTRLETSADQVRTLAQEACNGAAPAYLAQEMDLSACPILVPERLYFRCGG